MGNRGKELGRGEYGMRGERRSGKLVMGARRVGKGEKWKQMR